MSAQVIRYDDAQPLANDVAERFITLLKGLQAEGHTPQIALTGGTAAHALYAAIAAKPNARDLDWTGIDFWWGDERFVPADSPDRNANDARATLLDRLGATRIHEMPTTNSACSVDEGARAYEAQLRSVPADCFDLVLLSLGPDGHVASLFPGSPQVEVTGRIAVGVTGSPKPPPERITLTFEALNRTDRMWLLAFDSGPGGAKHELFERAIAGDAGVPAARVHGRRETIWFAC